jgi:hypothetical protein
MDQQYGSFIERMRAENPGNWPEPTPEMMTDKRQITDDAAYAAVAVDDENLGSLCGTLAGRAARLVLTGREIHITTRGLGRTQRAVVPLRDLDSITVTAAVGYQHLAIKYRLPGEYILQESGADRHGRIALRQVEDLNAAMDIVAMAIERARSIS